MRIGELEALTWNDIDLRRNIIHIRPKATWQTKNGKSREVPIHDRVRDVIRQLPKLSTYVFVSRKSAKYPNADGPICERRVLPKLKAVLKTMGIPGKLHSFRHFFASYMAAQGVQPFKLMKWLGHSSLDMVLKYYHDNESVEAMQAVCKKEKEEAQKVVPIRFETAG